MTFRRRLFVATLTVGGGICCFQPFMRSRMEARLSELLGGQVEIGSSRVSLRDSTIALSDIFIPTSDVILPNELVAPNDLNKTRAPIKIGQAALKFSWDSIFYRNLKVESFLASDVSWEITTPNNRSVPSAIEAGNIRFLTQDNVSNSPNARVESLVQPIKMRLTEESAKQNQTQQKISSQLKSIAQRLAEVLPSDGSLNVLRQRFIVEDATKEIASLRQSIAEDGLARKKADKAINALKLSAQQQVVSKASLEPELDRERAKQAALDIAKIAIAKEWNSSRPIVQAAVSSLNSLQDSSLVQRDRFGTKREKRNDMQTASLSNLAVGLTQCSTGRINGRMQLPPQNNEERESSFVLQFWNLSSRTLLDAQKPTVTLRLNNAAAPEVPPWMTCTAQQIALPQSDTLQIQLTLEKMDGRRGMSSTKIQHANQGWAATISMPTQCCLEMPDTKTIAMDPSPSNEKSLILGKLIGTTPSDEQAQNDLLIEVDPTSLATLETILITWHTADSEKKRVQASRRGSELLNSELLSLDAHWEQLGDEHVRAHDNWKSRMSELDDQLKTLGAAFKRTSRAASSIVR